MPDTSYVGMFSYLFLIFLPTPQAHKGPQRPMKANAGQRKPTAANDGQRRPTQCISVRFLSFFILYAYYYETAPTPPLACKYELGVGLLTTTNHPPSPPPPPHHQQHHQQPTMGRRPTKANDGQQ